MTIIAELAAAAKKNSSQPARTISAPARPIPTVDHLLTAPLAQLIAEQGVCQVIDSSITDEIFCGAALVDDEGTLILHLPVGRDPRERDEAVRKLIATVHGLSEDIFTGPVTTTDITKHVEGRL